MGIIGSIYGKQHSRSYPINQNYAVHFLRVTVLTGLHRIQRKVGCLCVFEHNLNVRIGLEILQSKIAVRRGVYCSRRQAC